MADSFEFKVPGAAAAESPSAPAKHAAPPSEVVRQGGESSGEEIQLGSEAYARIAQESLAEHPDLAQIAVDLTRYLGDLQQGKAQPDAAFLATMLTNVVAAVAVNLSSIEADVDELGQIGLSAALEDVIDELSDIVSKEILAPQVKRRLSALVERCEEALGEDDEDE